MLKASLVVVIDGYASCISVDHYENIVFSANASFFPMNSILQKHRRTTEMLSYRNRSIAHAQEKKATHDGNYHPMIIVSFVFTFFSNDKNTRKHDKNKDEEESIVVSFASFFRQLTLLM